MEAIALGVANLMPTSSSRPTCSSPMTLFGPSGKSRPSTMSAMRMLSTGPSIASISAPRRSVSPLLIMTRPPTMPTVPFIGTGSLTCTSMRKSCVLWSKTPLHVVPFESPSEKVSVTAVNSFQLAGSSHSLSRQSASAAVQSVKRADPRSARLPGVIPGL